MKKNIYSVIPIRDQIIYPGSSKIVIIGRQNSIESLKKAIFTNKKIFLLLQKNIDQVDLSKNDLYDTGIIAEIKHYVELPDSTYKATLEGLSIAKINNIESDSPFLASASEIEYSELTSSQKDVYSKALLKAVTEYSKITKKFNNDDLINLINKGELEKLVYVLATHLNLPLYKQQTILEAKSFEEQLDTIIELINTELELIKLDDKINQRVKEQMSQSNRDYHLSEQIKAIQKEMGKDDEYKEDLKEIELKLNELKLSDSVRALAEKELKKARLMHNAHAEYAVTRNYLDLFVNLPWGIKSSDNLDQEHAENILNRDHFGLDKPKERILEYLAVKKLSDNLNGSIICFVGPPGVGKTSLAKSIAEAMGKKFVRMSMGGLRDEAEIKGHRKTYIGALPGKIIQSIKKAGSENPVLLLDEIDKMSSDYRGDPASALLEVLDPEQNKYFVDNYLEAEFDLSNVFFITTANTLDTIPTALLDRMEVIEISGYTEEEKHNIATRYLIPKQLKKNGIKEDILLITSEALTSIIRYYTREAGVRNLERELASLMRKVARKVAKSDYSGDLITITENNLEDFLGKPNYRIIDIEAKFEHGLATGLAWTPYGGETLQIEVAVFPGTGNLMVTGQLGNVMQESAKTALSVVKSRASRFDIPMDKFKDFDIHLHVPEGAVPKDGPSAGVCMTIALISGLSDYLVNAMVAMTGEITLRGKVLPVGGIREKVLAAYRLGIKEIIIPKDNEKDLTDINENVKSIIKFHLVSTIDEIFDLNIIKRGDLLGS